MKCAIYVRAAEASDADRATRTQLEDCWARAAALGYPDVDIAVFDEGLRGGDSWWVGGGPGNTGSREALAKLLAAVEAGEIAAVITQTRDRISRYDAIWDGFVSKLQERDVALVVNADGEAPPIPRRGTQGAPPPAGVSGPTSSPGSLDSTRLAQPRQATGYVAASLPDEEGQRRPCAIYLRSARQNGAAESIQAQRGKCLSAAKQCGFDEDEIAIYDEGVMPGNTWWTSAGREGGRPALSRLVAAAEAGHVHVVIVATTPVVSHIAPIRDAFRSEVLEPHAVELVAADQLKLGRSTGEGAAEVPEDAAAEALDRADLGTEIGPPVRAFGHQLARGVGLAAAAMAVVVILAVVARGIRTEGRAEYHAAATRQQKQLYEAQKRANEQQKGGTQNQKRVPALVYYAQFAQQFMALGDIDSAIEKARQLTIAQPNNPNAAICLALLNAVKGNTDDAVRTLQSVASRDTHNPEPLLILASISVNANDLIGAERYLKAAAKADPSDARPTMNLATLYLQNRHLDQAKEVYKAAIARNTGDPDLRYAYALLLVKSGDRANADEQMRILQGSFASTGLASVLQAEVDVADNKLDEAAKALQQATRINPQLSSAYRLLGAINMKQGKRNEALDAYEKAIGAGAVDAVTYNELAYLYADSKRNSEDAIKLAQTAAVMDPGNPHIADTLGWALYAKGDYERAANVLRVVVQHPQATPTHRFHLGMALLKQGNSEGYADIQAAMAADPGAEWTPQAKKALSGKLN